MENTGFTPIPSHLYRTPGMDVNTWALLNALAQYADHQGYCFPSQGRLGQELGRSRAWVNKYIFKLVEMGLIEKHHRTRVYDKGNTSCGYYIPSIHEFHMSKSVTPPVTEDDINNQNQNNQITLLNNEDNPQIDNWFPSHGTMNKAIETLGSNTQFSLNRFKQKIRAKGYYYKDYDEAWLLWIYEDKKQPSLPVSHRDTKKTNSVTDLEHVMKNVLSKRGVAHHVFG